MKKSSVYLWISIVGLIVITFLGTLTYYRVVIFQDDRENSIRTALQHQWQRLSFESNYQSEIKDSLDCQFGYGFAGEPKGYYCLGGLSQIHGFYESEAQALELIAAQLGKNGWTTNPYGSGNTGYKIKGDERLTVSFHAETKESLQKLLEPDEFSSSYSQQITREETEPKLKIFAAEPNVRTLISVTIKAVPMEPEWLKRIPEALR